LHGEPEAVRRLDDLITSQVLSASIVRVKLWKPDGTIVYSDEPALIGNRYALRNEELALFASGEADAELSDLNQPENRYERPEGKLLEAPHDRLAGVASGGGGPPAGSSVCSGAVSAGAFRARMVHKTSFEVAEMSLSLNCSPQTERPPIRRLANLSVTDVPSQLHLRE
jgi:hypothetical protein